MRKLESSQLISTHPYGLLTNSSIRELLFSGTAAASRAGQYNASKLPAAAVAKQPAQSSNQLPVVDPAIQARKSEEWKIFEQQMAVKKKTNKARSKKGVSFCDFFAHTFV